MKKNFVFSLVFSTALVFPLESMAQFQRFESDTELDSRPTPSRSERPSERSRQRQQGNQRSAETLIDRTQQTDAFGRGTGLAPVTDSETASRFVNLNPETAFGPEVIKSFDFPDTSLVELTRHMQELTGINLILDEDLRGNISIMAPTPITVGDAWKAYLTALNVNGYTMVKSGEFYKIVNARDIRYTPTKIYTGDFTPETDNYVMRIIPMQHIDSGEVTRSFRPFMSRYGRIIEIQQTNTIIVQDTGSNINRLVRLIEFIDVPGHEESLQIIPVENTSAQELAQLLDQILQSSGPQNIRRARPRGEGGAPPAPGGRSGEAISRIIAEPRTNSIIAMANASGARQLRELIAKLDVEVTRQGDGRIHVYYLNHGDAENLAETLNSLIASSGGGARTSRQTRGGVEEEDRVFNENIKITADRSNNALVVTASPTDYMTIREVIAQLDIPRDQVYVEGLMMETNVSRERGFGISVIGAYGTGGTQKAGFTGGQSDLFDLLTNNITSLGGLFVGGGAGSTITQDLPNGQTIEIQSVNALLTAVATNTDTNVLATPQILALDNTEAIFEVGETIPTLERATDPSGSSTVSTSQQKVALTLKITPQINRVTRFVRLAIDQKIEDFSSRQLPDGLRSQGIATTTRSAVTSVVVRDRDTIAMGGLMRDRETYRESKVPLLGDVPVLGWLFRNTRREVTKVNLLFFLTPRILANYQRDNAENVQDVLARRAHHLKSSLGADDPFATTVKGVYDKAEQQAQGPLFDPSEIIEDTHEIRRPTDNVMDEEYLSDEIEVPDYGMIIQQLNNVRSAPKKD